MKHELTKIYRELSEGMLSKQAALARIKALKQADGTAADACLYAAPAWESSEISTEASAGGSQMRRHVVLLDLPRIEPRDLQTLLPDGHCESVRIGSDQTIAESYTRCALAVFESIQQMLDAKPRHPVLVQLVVADRPTRQMFAGLSGLLRTVTLENPSVTGQIVFVPVDTPAPALARLLRMEAGKGDALVRYGASGRIRRRWQIIEGDRRTDMPVARECLFKENGVYLITGGLGSLGMRVAEQIQKQTASARIILTGRTALTDARQGLLRRLQQAGRVEYCQLDVADAAQVAQTIATIVGNYGQLNGVIHAAGVVADSFILKKTPAELRSVLAPKVTGTFNLDVATQAIELDFFVLFSSLASCLGNVGQADYAAANGFMDEFASHRAELVALGQRKGRTLSVSWPHWHEGGMQIDSVSLEAIRRRTGLESLRTEEGMQALYRCLSEQKNHLLALKGDHSRIRRALAADQSMDRAAPPARSRIEVNAQAAPDSSGLAEQTREFLRQQLSIVLKVPAQRIDVRAPLESYGIDSRMALSLTTQLEATFGPLAKTLFFEYLTIDELARYFLRSHAQTLGTLFAAPATALTSTHRPSEKRQRAHTALASAPAAAIESTDSNRTTRRPAVDDLIAIVGLSGRYPEARDLEAFWNNLRDGKDCIVEVPKERWDWREYYSADRTQEGRHYSKWGGFIEGVDEFDPRFFNISPREARAIDPQERLFLQHAWLAIEDAGYTRTSLQIPHGNHLPGQVGVYAGVMYGEYNLSGTLASIANRVSAALNLHGPSLTLDTMCSSSLTAIHLACQDLKLGRTELAIAGGVNVSVHPGKYKMLSAGQFISSDGHCQSFGEGGDGYIPGEGVGVVVLKRLSDAERDGNPIYGVIRGSALNHGGRTNGYTVPNPQAQADVIRHALAEAGVNPRHISYIEAHGTGTKLGDPIEIAALTKAFDDSAPESSGEVGFCLIGSAKSNIGHCESAAGIAGVTKVLLQMKHRSVVPSLHSARLNPHIDFKATPFIVNQTLQPWVAPEVEGRRLPRIAGISSFGAGGANAHILISEYPAPAVRAQPLSSPVIVPLSARTEAALREKAVDLLAFIERQAGEVDLQSLAYTLQVGREAMSERAAFVAGTIEQLTRDLRAFSKSGVAGDGMYRAQAQPQEESVPEQWISERQLTNLAAAWVRGSELNWRELLSGSPPRMMSLPGYPFARERYWIEPSPASVAVVEAPVLHPLVHANTSDIFQQSYSATFKGTESFLEVDVTTGQRILPAAKVHDMMRAALELAVPGSSESGHWQLNDMAWGEPIAVTVGKPVHVALLARDPHVIDVEIYSESGEGAADIVHCQCQAILDRQTATPRLPEQIEPSLMAAIAKTKPTGIALASTDDWSARQTIKKPVVALDPPGTRRLAAPSVGGLDDLGEGVFRIDTGSTDLHEDASGIIERLLQAIKQAQRQSSLKVLLIEAGETELWRGGRGVCNRAIERGLFSAIASFPYPVVAVLPEGARGAGLLLAAVCDFMICGQEGHYGYTDARQKIFPTPGEQRFFRERQGTLVSNDFLYQSTLLSGEQLAAKGWGCQTAPSAQVQSRARDLARNLAEKSQTALRLLKAHLARRLVPLIDALQVVDTQAWSIGVTAEQASASSEITSSAASFRLETSSNDVLVIELAHSETSQSLRRLVAELRSVLDQVNASSHYCSVVLTGDPLGWSQTSADAESLMELRDLVQRCRVPVIAAFNSDLEGVGWLLALWCDACIYREQGRYSARDLWSVPKIAREASSLFVQGLGCSLGHEVCLTTARYSGLELQARAGALIVADSADVLPRAMRLAAFWRQWPRSIVSAWKRDRCSHLQDLLAAQPEWRSLRVTESTAGSNVMTSVPAPIALRSSVVTASAHPDGVVVVSLQDRDAKNMFTESLVDGLKEVFARIERSPEYKAVVLTGYDSYFATGGTRETLLAIQDGQSQFTDDKAFQLPMECSLPVIAAMQGHGIGAGWSFGMFSDVVLYSSESRYLSPYMDYGFTPGAGATWVFPEKIGYDLARETLFTAKEISGQTLEERGLRIAVLPRREVVSAAIELGRRMARQPREQLQNLKAQWITPQRGAREDAYQREVQMHDRTFVGQADTLARIQAKFARESVPETVSEPVPAAPVVVADEGASLAAVAAKLRGILAAELHLRPEEIDDDTQFIDLGLDSITAVTWIRNINEHYRTHIEATKVYNFPTLREISVHVQQEAERAGTLPKAVPVAPPVKSQPQTAAPPKRAPVEAAKKLRSWRRRGQGTRIVPEQSRSAEVVRAEVSQPPPVVEAPAIAVIGMAGQFPQARNIDEFWANIAAGRNCISEVSADRWDVNALFQPGAPVAGKTNSKWLGALEEYDRFDPLFFNISPTEAQSMDPQQRLFLQACWHSIENAGYNPHSLSGRQCGVFVGCAANDYHEVSREHRLSAQGFTGSSVSILAARIAYFLNLRGPCISIDTACSSSLVAIANACDSLISGSSEVALAGGVYVMGGPALHIMSSQAGMLSADGRCFTFDQRANGFVPGEAVGVLMLKRLSDAERDQDRILGVIQGWAVNQDGKTNGITAPNEESQTRLLQDVYRRFDIDPGGIQLIEAHGTGTKLGDPIEVAGLKGAFRSFTDRREYCALGSVKSNIGHCLTAAGAAGIIKLIQALRHRQLPPTINYSKCNEHIRLEGSPFYVNDSLRPWEVASEERRRAAISSFGFSGTNAHLVIAEPVASGRAKPPVSAVAQQGKVIAPLSARTPEQLRQAASDLSAWLRQRDQFIDLIDVAYTLQVGRDQMDERVAFLASTRDELIEQLETYVAGGSDAGTHRGNAKRNREEIRLISQDEQTRTTLIEQWLSQNKLAQLASAWAKGLPLDWTRLYGQTKPLRIELPNYPFAKERCWIDVPAIASASARPGIHPLLHENVSLLGQQRYRTTITGEEPCVDTRIAGKQLLPPMALLEMARAAVIQATGELSRDVVIQIAQTRWQQPCFLADGGTTLLIDLAAHDDESIGFEVRYAEGEGDDAVVVRGLAGLQQQRSDAHIDLASLRRSLPDESLDAAALYATLERAGVAVGKAMRGLGSIHRGNDQLLARISLPGTLDSMHQDYVLHPALIESIVPAGNALLRDQDEFQGRVLLPSSIAALTVSAALDSEVWAWIRIAEQSESTSHSRTVDIDLLDAHGRSRVQIRGLVLEPYPPGDLEHSDGLTLMTPRWDVVASFDGAAPSRSGQSILVIGADESQRSVLEYHYGESELTFVSIAASDDPAAVRDKLAGLQFEKLLWLAGAEPVTTLTEESIIADQDRGIVQVLRIARALASLGYEKQAIEWDLITFRSLPVRRSGTINPTHAGLLGFAGSLSEAYPAWHIRLLDLETLCADAAMDLQQLPRQATGSCFALRGREWLGQKLVPVKTLPQVEAPYRYQGVYVAIGGSGGIGEIWTRHLVEQYQAKVIWIGRRELNDEIRSKIATLSCLGPEPEYIQADATDLRQLTAAVEDIKRRHARIHGVVHSAVGALDQSLKTVSEQDFRAILSVKIDLSVRVAQVFQHEPLDFILFFSSNASFVRWGGMSGYSAGCTFKDAFARQLGKLRTGTVKVVNWGYWSVGAGAAFTDAMKTVFHQTGHRPLDPKQAMRALDHFLAGRLDQLSIASIARASTAQRAAGEEWLASYQEAAGKDIKRWDLPLLESLDLSPAFDGMTVRIGGEMEAPLIRLLRGILRSTPEVIGAYDRWLQESQKIVGLDPGAEPAPTLEQLWSEWNEARREWLRDEGKRALCDLVDKCMRALPDILTGKRKATDVMFPGSSLELVESVYKTGSISRAFNDCLCDSLVAAIEARLRADPDARIRLLEIGAGTGATTTQILDRLEPYRNHIVEYCYTDISKTFLFHAESVYKPRAPYLRTQLFNVEEPIAQQGLAAGRYDFVIAANVIHATRNIRNTLRNAKAVLREQGMLLLNEISAGSICGHVTFGLLGGWWLNEDDAIRIPGSPGLYPESWTQILEDEGFHPVAHPTREVQALGLQIILAISDGLVRQKESMREAAVSAAPAETAAVAAHPVAPLLIERNTMNDETQLREKTIQFCRQLIGKALKLNPEQIDATEPLESYGIDSLIVGLVNQQLQRHFESVSSTVLYEFQTVTAIAGHLLETQRATLGRLFKLDQMPASVAAAAPQPRAPVANEHIPIGVKGRRSMRVAPAGNNRQPIAIVGISGLYPQAPTLDEFWENLKAGRNCVTEIPPERWSLEGFYEPDEGKAVEQGKSYCKWGGFVDQFAQFDTLFFGIAPREALNMDPQERLFLQAAWSALENAGYTRNALREQFKRRVGVFAGVTRAGYNLYRPVFDPGEKFWPRTSFGSVANRLSYLLDINGPSVPVDTMCSSSLTAIHEACEHIHNGDCDLAIAGGVNLYLHPTSFVDMSSQHMLSKDGACRSFGKGGNGFVPGEGVGVVVLKPLARAIADQDIIHGVILATHVNHGGKTSGFTVPNPVAQAELVRAALDKAGISARDVSYIEAHGTGTELGDPIEISGLQQAFAKDTRETGYCRIGSAKSNIGHLEAAAGIAGLTKVLLQLKHGQIAPSLHASQLNPHIRFEQTPFEVNQELIPWERPVVGGKPRPRIAGVSSFGAGGANAHVILQEYQPAKVKPVQRTRTGGEVLVPLSARTADQLLQKARDLRDAIGAPACDLEAIAYTLQTGREAMDERLCFVVSSLEQLARNLDAYVSGEEQIEGVHRGRVQRNDRVSLLVQDDDIGAAIERWLARHKFFKFAQLWVQGLDFDWHKLYGDNRPRRVELPTYPFAKDRYWIDSVGASPSTVAPLRAASKAPSLQNLHLIEDVIDRIDGASLDSAQGAELLRKLV